MIEPGVAELPVVRQCELLGVSRSSAYYEPVPVGPEELALMALIDRQYLATPFYGTRRMTAWLRTHGHAINRKRVRRLMQLMGLEAIYRRPRTSRPATDHRVYPYLLRDLAIERVNQVWAADITYIPMARGFLYLVAIMDWVSRLVVAWRLSNTLDTAFCLDALGDALALGRPDISNTDQGSQFTSQDYTGTLERHGIRISMDGRGRFSDNIFVERLWRSVKYEEVYLHAYDSGAEAHAGLDLYFRFYNDQRLHQALGYRTPRQVFEAGAGPWICGRSAARTGCASPAPLRDAGTCSPSPTSPQARPPQQDNNKLNKLSEANPGHHLISAP